MAKNYLVVVDMQNDFVTGPLGSPAAAAIVPSVCARVRTFDGAVVFTLDTHDEGYLRTHEGRRLPVPHCIRGTVGWALVPEIEALRAQLGARVFEKPGFGSLSLATFLCAENGRTENVHASCGAVSIDCGTPQTTNGHTLHDAASIADGGPKAPDRNDAPDAIGSIELIGLCTDICVVSNALLLRAHLPETEIRVNASCCAGTTPENHEAALAIMRSCLVQIV